MRRTVEYHTHFLHALLCLAIALGAASSAAQTFVTNTYTVSAEEFANPERGFYLHTETRASAPSPVPANLANLRINGSRDPNNAYLARISLVLRVFYLDLFTNAPISSNYLNIIDADFASIRHQGAKAIVRFAYFQSSTRPFPEPSKARILEHIGQLAPVFRKNRDVITVLQQGFIGAWGEGYYTDVFSTAGQAFTAQNWRDRAEVIQALVEALPHDRMIQVRVPQQRQKFLHGPAAPTTTSADADAAAFMGSAARIGFHNDCFLADATDAGTFSSYDALFDPADPARLRNYQALETRFTVMGGETCIENAPADNCATNGGRADGDLALFHYSFLNQGYNANVNDDWVAQGCLEDIKRRLGYRLELVESVLPSAAQPGESVPLRLELRNSGYAAPFNPRGIELILRHTNSGQRFFAELSRDNDARCWLPGTNLLLIASLSLPTNLPAGRYECLLHLPDPSPSLHGLAHYSIRLANATAVNGSGISLGTVWEPSTGYHRLGQTLSIGTAPTNPPSIDSDIPVLPYSAIRENYDTWRARTFPPGAPDTDPTSDPDADSWENLVEYAAGTNPISAFDPPAHASYEGGELILSIKKAPGVKDVAFEIESSSDLSSGNWSAASVTILANTPRTRRVRISSNGARGFVRLRAWLNPQ